MRGVVGPSEKYAGREKPGNTWKFNVLREGGAYHCFAGREAGRGLARSSLDEADVARGADLSDLSADELETLAQWEAKFRSKYPVVGRLIAAAPASKL